MCLTDPAGFLTKTSLGSKPEVFVGDLASCLQDWRKEAPPLPPPACFPLLFCQFLNRPFRVVFNLQQSLRLDLLLYGFQMITKEKKRG